ncbi:MAG: glycosyl hydrolase [Sedimentisphaerales bacterium]|nr:glycosyl hydrolase [Sedimentisphaerales bacterium]
MTLNLGCALLALTLATTCLADLPDLDQIRQGFVNPPDDARIMMRWWWFGPAVTKAELEHQMQLMKEGGIGGFEVQPTYPLSTDDPNKGIRNLRFLSEEFLDAVAFTASKAKELGLRFDLTLGSGWPYGGPQFDLSQAAGRIRYVDVKVTDGIERQPLPVVKEAERVFAAFVGPFSDPNTGTNSYRQLQIADGYVLLPEDCRKQTRILFFIVSQTGMRVKRAAYGAEGYVIDHYRPEVIKRFIEQIAEPVLNACGENRPYAVFCDSLEVAGEDWTYDLLDEFKARRGYDLLPYLPALFDPSFPSSAEIRHDWGRTLTEIYTEYFNAAFQRWAREKGTRFRIQGYGSPPAALFSYAYADLCEGEGFNWDGFRESRWAASASHLLGRQVTSSETWTWLHSPVFMATPLDMKAEADMHFLQGINQIIGHGWPYSPQQAGYPGWRFYAAGVFNEKNPWWIVMPDLSLYLQRISFLMRQGIPANDVLLYLPNSDAWARFVPGRVSMNADFASKVGDTVIRSILEAGFNLDFCDDQLLQMRGQVSDGAIYFGDICYRAVVLPGVERMPASTIKTLEAFARSGGILVASRRIPDRAGGLKASKQEGDMVYKTATSLFKGPDAKAILVADDSQVGSAIASRLQPDVKISPAGTRLGFVHRKAGQVDIYLLVNGSNAPVEAAVTFRQTGKCLQYWDGLTGQVRPIAADQSSDKATTTSLALEPYGSAVLVFAPGQGPSASSTMAGKELLGSIDITTNWKVIFSSAAGDEDPEPMIMERVRCWTDYDHMTYFSGIGSYQRPFDLDQQWLRPGVRIILDLGTYQQITEDRGGRGAIRGGGRRFRAMIDPPIKDAAVVYVNGTRAGAVWCPPYSLDITDLVRPGINELRIDVANRAVNYMAKDPPRDYRQEYRQLIEQFGDRFQPQDMDQIRPMPSGLTGPITIKAVAAAGG